ncbi:MAG: hypothetical protein H7Z40_23085 [Phycisphaerae bacterium]|nr:hypothetical protein [Gemmatimonadaceae bacterium]
MNSVNVTHDMQVVLGKRAMWRRRLIASVCAASLMLQQGCYNAVPVTGAAPPPSGTVTIRVNDRGRLLVGSRLGPLVDKLQGRIVRSDSLQVEMAVDVAEDVRGSIARWGGERFVIPRDGISAINEKKLSKKRTWLLVGVMAAGLAIFYAGGRALSFFGSSGTEGPGPEPI